MTNDNEKPSHHGVGDATVRNYQNETIKLLIERASCRSFSNQPVPDDLLSLILESGMHAATGGNLQPYSIIKITDADTKKKLAILNEEQMFIATAPVNLLFCLDWHRLMRWAKLQKAPFAANNSFRHFWISFQDTIIAAQNICTAADALGLGSVYIGTVLECFRELRDLFSLPPGVFPVVLLSLGYPKVRPMPKKKLGLAVLVHDEKYHLMSDEELLAVFEQKYPAWKKEITPERLAVFERVCRTLYGDEFCHECLEAVHRQGYFSAAQNYFGLHYVADLMIARNAEFLETMEDFGFGWFKP